MSSQWFLSYLKEQFDSNDCREIIQTFRLNPLIWKAVSTTEHPEDWIAFAGNNLFNWKVSTFSLFVLRPDLVKQDFQNLQTDFPNDLQHKSERLLETIRSANLEPNNLSDATLLALSLRNFRHSNDGWQGLFDFLTENSLRLDVWKTSFAVLPALVPDLEDALCELFDQCTDYFTVATLNLIINTINSQLISENDRFNFYLSLAANSNSEKQNQLLSLLDTKEAKAFLVLLAQSFLDENTDHLSLLNSYQHIKTLLQEGSLKKKADRKEEAFENIEQAKEAFKNLRATFLYNTALILEKLQPEEARKTWEEVLSLEPDKETFISEYAEFLIAEGDIHQALYLLNTLSDRSSTLLYALRYPSFREIQPGAEPKIELDQLSQIVSLNPSRFLTQSDRFFAAQYAFEQHDLDNAKTLIFKALTDTPNDKQALQLSAEINEKLANLNYAIECASLLVALEPENLEHKVYLTKLYIKALEPQKALQTFGEIIKASSQVSREDLLFYSNLSIDAGQPEIAIPIARKFLAQDAFDGEAMVILCEALIKNNQTQEAREILNKASALAPEKPNSWLSLSQIWTILGEEEQALNALQRARIALPDDPQILTALGKLYLKQEHASEATSTLKQAKQIDPINLEASIALTSSLLKQGYVDEAWDNIQAFENDFNSDPQLALVLANTLAAKKESQRALAIYKFAWQSLRSNEALLAYMNCLLSQSRADEKNKKQSIQDLEILLPSLQDRNATYEANFEMKLLEADVKAELGEIEEAYEDYAYLLDLPEAKAPRFYQHLQRQIGIVALDLGLGDISMTALQEAIGFNPEDLTSRHVLSHAYVKSGLIDEAIETAQNALLLSPTDTDNVIWYAKFMVENNRPHEAIQALKDAVFSKPGEQILHLTLARVYLANMAIDESKITLSRMLETTVLSTSDYLNIAMLYSHMNEESQAINILQRAISENNNMSFNESNELVYALLDLGAAQIALNYLESIKPKHAQQSCFNLLRSDVYTALGQYFPALEALEPVLRRLEQGQSDYLQTSFDPSQTAEGDHLPFNNAGTYLRVAQLQYATANYQEAINANQLALKYDTNNPLAQRLNIELALICSDKAELEIALDRLNQLDSFNETDREIAKLLTLDAILDDEFTKANLFIEHFADKSDPDPICMAVKVLLADMDGQEYQSLAFLQVMKERFKNINQDTSKVQSLSGQFSEIWRILSIAKVAWQMQDWDFADLLFKHSLQSFKTNPRINLTFATYLCEKNMVKANAEALFVQRHLPKPVSAHQTDKSLFEEQLNIIKRFSDQAYAQNLEIIGQAVFTNKTLNDTDLHGLLEDKTLATIALNYISNPNQIALILASFPHNEKLSFQYALNQLTTHPEKTHEILDDLPIKAKNQALHYAANAIAYGNNHKAASESWSLALSIWPDEAEWFVQRAKSYKENGELSFAEDSLKEALVLEPNHAPYWQALGEVNYLQKDYHTARSHYEKANTLRYNNVQVLEALSEINRKLGENEKAVAYLNELHLQKPDEHKYLESLAELHFIARDYDKALNYANQVIDSSLSCERAIKVKIETLIVQQAFDEAYKLANDAMLIAKDPISFEIYRIRIEARENPGVGLRMATNLAHEHPDYPSVLNLLAEYQLKVDQQKNAEKTLSKSLRLDPANPETLLALGTLSRLNGAHEQAQLILKQAIELEPSLIEAYLEIGLSYEDQRLNDQAISIYNKAIEQVSKDPRPYVQAANAYKASRDFRSAELMLQQAAQLAPTDQSIRRQLAAIVAQNLVNNLQEGKRK